MKAVVTGAGGFVGRHLVEHLHALGDEVVPLDRTATTPVDVTDAGQVQAALLHARPEAVYHLAALSHIGESWDAPGRVLRVNAEGTLHVLRACVDAHVERVLVVGSADEYGSVGPEELPLAEDAPLRPLTPYGASKVAAEFLALQAFLGEGLATLRVRAFNHTGPRQPARFVVPGLARRIAAAEHAGRSDVPVGSLEPVRDLLDVRDVVRAYRLLVERGTPGEVYNVCSGRGISVRELAERLLARSDASLHLVPDASLLRAVEVPRLVGDPSKLEAATSWKPEHDLDDTLGEVLDEARAATRDGAR